MGKTRQIENPVRAYHRPQDNRVSMGLRDAADALRLAGHYVAPNHRQCGLGLWLRHYRDELSLIAT